MPAAAWLVTGTGPSALDDRGGAVVVPHQPESVRVVRHRLQAELAVAGVTPGLRDDVELVAGELVGNCVRHARPLAGGGIRVSWRLVGGLVDLQVTDGGSASEVRPRLAGPTEQCGRGLRVVDALCHAWGVITLPGAERTVWADLVEPGTEG
jgi:anti-sigma regulatory factor (Ser/Thr protein kinase)